MLWDEKLNGYKVLENDPKPADTDTKVEDKVEVEGESIDNPQQSDCDLSPTQSESPTFTFGDLTTNNANNCNSKGTNENASTHVVDGVVVSPVTTAQKVVTKQDKTFMQTLLKKKTKAAPKATYESITTNNKEVQESNTQLSAKSEKESKDASCQTSRDMSCQTDFDNEGSSSITADKEIFVSNNTHQQEHIQEESKQTEASTNQDIDNDNQTPSAEVSVSPLIQPRRIAETSIQENTTSTMEQTTSTTQQEGSSSAARQQEVLVSETINERSGQEGSTENVSKNKKKKKKKSKKQDNAIVASEDVQQEISQDTMAVQEVQPEVDTEIVEPKESKVATEIVEPGVATEVVQPQDDKILEQTTIPQETVSHQDKEHIEEEGIVDTPKSTEMNLNPQAKEFHSSKEADVEQEEDDVKDDVKDDLKSTPTASSKSKRSRQKKRKQEIKKKKEEEEKKKNETDKDVEQKSDEANQDKIPTPEENDQNKDNKKTQEGMFAYVKSFFSSNKEDVEVKTPDVAKGRARFFKNQDAKIMKQQQNQMIKQAKHKAQRMAVKKKLEAEKQQRKNARADHKEYGQRVAEKKTILKDQGLHAFTRSLVDKPLRNHDILDGNYQNI